MAARLPSELIAHVWFQKERGGLFSVALSVRMPRGIASRVYPEVMLPVTRHRALRCSDFPPLQGLPQEEAILRPSKIDMTVLCGRIDFKRSIDHKTREETARGGRMEAEK